MKISDLNWLYLVGAILSEVVATSALKATKGFTQPIPSAIVVIGYISTYYCLSLSLRTIPIGVAYAIWSGVGLVLVSIIALFYYGQKLNPISILGMTLISIGVLILNIYSSPAE